MLDPNVFLRLRMSKPIIQWDHVVKGLGMRLNRDGSRQFIAKMSINGRPKWFTIGPIDLIRMDDARQLVQRMKLIARQGDDPADLIKTFVRSQGEKIDPGITLEDFAPKYLKEIQDAGKESWKNDERHLRLHLLPKLGKRRLTDISRDDFKKLYTKLGKTKKIAANHVRQTLAQLYKEAVYMGYVPNTFVHPTDGLKPFRKEKRRIRIPNKMLPALVKAIEDYPKTMHEKHSCNRLDHHQVYANAFLLILCLGLRHNECKRLKWDYIDFDEGTIMLPSADTKNRRGHLIPLSAPVARLLKSFRRYPHNPYVFPSLFTRGGHVARLDKAWDKIRTAANLQHLWIHDLRRTVACYLLEQTGTLEAGRGLLNHSYEGMTAEYSFYDIEALRPILDIHARKIEGMMQRYG